MSELTPIPFDSIHMVVYSVQKTSEGFVPNANGGLREGYYQSRAVLALLREGQSSNVVIGGINYGCLDGSVRISQVYAEDLRRNLHVEGISGVNVIAEAEELPADQIETGAKDTGGEIDFVLAQARLRGWRKLLCVAYDQHLPRVKGLYKSRGTQVLKDYTDVVKEEKVGVGIYSSFAILADREPETHQQFLDREWMSGVRISNREHELFMRAIMMIDRKGRSFTWLASKLSHEAKYKLNTVSGQR